MVGGVDSFEFAGGDFILKIGSFTISDSWYCGEDGFEEGIL